MNIAYADKVCMTGTVKWIFEQVNGRYICRRYWDNRVVSQDKQARELYSVEELNNTIQWFRDHGWHVRPAPRVELPYKESSLEAPF